MECKECEYCQMTRRADIKFARADYGSYGRGIFYCTHPDIQTMPVRAFGNRAPGFIEFGTMEKDSVVQIKTAPRWCPRRKAGRENGQVV